MNYKKHILSSIWNWFSLNRWTNTIYQQHVIYLGAIRNRPYYWDCETIREIVQLCLHTCASSWPRKLWPREYLCTTIGIMRFLLVHTTTLYMLYTYGMFMCVLRAIMSKTPDDAHICVFFSPLLSLFVRTYMRTTKVHYQ